MSLQPTRTKQYPQVNCLS